MDICISDEDFPEELLETVKQFNAGIENLDNGFKDLLNLNRTELFETLDPITR